MSSPSKILLVDDDETVRNLYQLYLETHGYSVIAASTVAEALRVLKVEIIGMVILDIFLQQASGLELLRGIVAAQISVPVIIMSGVSRGDPIFQEAIESGAAGVFTKNYPLDTLLREVSRVMEKNGSVEKRLKTVR
jgi:DNA-binding NtrC family response regulator